MAPAHSTPQVETIKQYSGMVTVQRRVKDFPAAAGGGPRHTQSRIEDSSLTLTMGIQSPVCGGS